MKVLSLFDGISSGRLALERADNNGRLYYDHVISKKTGLGSSITNEAVTQITNNSIANNSLVVNLFFVGGLK